MMTVMTNVVQFAYWTVKKKRAGRPHCQQFGPVYILIVAALLILVQPVCMLVIGSWSSMPNFFFDGGDTGNACGHPGQATCSNGCAASLFDCHPDTGVCDQLTCADAQKKDPNVACACNMDSGALVPNTTVGLLIQIFGTYVGFALLFVGVFQATELHVKICKKYRKARGIRAPVEEDCAT